MQDLLDYLETIQPAINTALRTEIHSLRPLVRPVAEHVLDAGGKRLRPLLTILFARALGHTDDTIYPLACATELLHSATLLHDDIIDDALLRRGTPAAHTVFSPTRTILAGDALLALANLIVARYSMPALTACIAQAIMNTADGEIAEIEYMHSTQHTYEKYLEIIKGKTACLLQAACQLGALFAKATPEQGQAACDFGINLGIAFQIVDDALDFSPSAEATGKPVAGDLREGKLTPPLHMYLEAIHGKKRDDFLYKFTHSAFTDDEVHAIAAEVRTMGLDSATRAMAETYLAHAAQALRVLGQCTEKTILLQTLEYVKNRSK